MSADLEDEIVVLSIDNGRYYNLNEVASRIWALVERPISVAALIDCLVGEFEVDRAICQEEVFADLRGVSGASAMTGEPQAFRRKSEVEVRRLIGAAILVDAQGNHFGVNEVGVRIWELLAEAQSLDALVATLLREFEISDSRCREEAQAFLDELLARELVERAARG
jgi:hypothetical protein